MMPEVKIEALRDPFEKLVNYMDLCEHCMYGFPNDLWDQKAASSLRESYMKSAFGAMDFILKCYPELRNDDAVTNFLEEKMFHMQTVADSYYTCEDKAKMKCKSYDELCATLINKV